MRVGAVNARHDGKSPYSGHRFPLEAISHAIWLSRDNAPQNHFLRVYCQLARMLRDNFLGCGEPGYY